MNGSPLWKPLGFPVPMVSRVLPFLSVLVILLPLSSTSQRFSSWSTMMAWARMNRPPMKRGIMLPYGSSNSSVPLSGGSLPQRSTRLPSLSKIMTGMLPRLKT